ncbi:MAG: enolase C-terminal domain-like protein [Chloroflexia bacterium]
MGRASPDDVGIRLASIVDRDGFKAVNIRIGGVMGRDTDASPGRTDELIPTIRAALGNDVDINADANGGYSPARAVAVGRVMELYGYFHFEEPCPFPEIENTAQVAAALDIQIAGGEQDNSLQQFSRMIAMRAVDVVQPDVGYIGGMARARRVAEMADVAGIPCPARTLVLVFPPRRRNACTQYQEWSAEDQRWAEDVYEPRLQVVNGVVAGDEPGWGVTILPSTSSATYRSSSVGADPQTNGSEATAWPEPPRAVGSNDTTGCEDFLAPMSLVARRVAPVLAALPREPASTVRTERRHRRPD